MKEKEGMGGEGRLTLLVYVLPHFRDFLRLGVGCFRVKSADLVRFFVGAHG